MSNERELRIVQEGYRGSSLLYAFVGGAAAGAIAALLTAPASGQETRAKLRAYRERGRDQARHLPDAIKAATLAAEEAFLAALKSAQPEREPTPASDGAPKHPHARSRA